MLLKLRNRSVFQLLFKFIAFGGSFFSKGAFGQDDNLVKGMVLETSTELPIASATIQLLVPVDSTMVAYAIARAEGGFTIKVTTPGTYLLKVAALGYGTKFLSIEVPRETGEIKVYLEKQDITLKEFLLEEESPAKIRDDTTTYLVEKYRQDGERTLAEVLNNMPNFRVEEGGEVFFKNRRIDKVMLDGDDLIGENYAAAIKSLDPAVLNEVQVVENYQDNRFLSGVEAGSMTVLNLGVKDEKKQLLFGSLGLGFGPNSHNGIGNIFSYKGKFKAYLLGATNNIGVKREDLTMERQQGLLDNLPNAWTWTPLQRIDQYFPYFLKTSYENPNQERFGNLNLSFRPKDNISIVSVLNVYSDKNEFRKVDSTQFLVDPPFSISQIDTLSRAPRMIEHRLKAEVGISENTGLRFDHVIRSGENFLDQGLLFADGSLEEYRQQQMESNGTIWASTLELTKKLNEKNALVFGSFFQSENLAETLDSKSLNVDGGSNDIGPSISQGLKHQMYQSGVQIRWLWSGKSLRIENQFSFHNQKFDLDGPHSEDSTELLVEMQAMTPSLFQKLTWEKGKFNLSYSHRLERQQLTISQTTGNHRWNWQRDATLTFNANQDNIISGGFGIAIQPLYGSLLVDRPLFLDFRTAQQGSRLSVWNREINYFLSHHYSDIFKKRISVNSNLFWIRNPTFWTLNTMEVQPDLVFMKLGTTTMNQSRGIMFKIDKLVFPIRGNIRLDINLWEAGFEETINNVNRFSSSFTMAAGFRYLSAFKGPFNIEAKAYFQNNQLNVFQGDEVSRNSFKNLNQTVAARAKFGKLNSKLVFENFGFDRQYFQFVNYRIDYNLKERINLYSEGRNLLDTRTFAMGRFTPNQFSEKSYTLLGRVVIFGVNWYF